MAGELAPLAIAAGRTTLLTSDDEMREIAVRTRANVNQIYLSGGDCVDLESSVQIILTCNTGYRLPEPIRQAHMVAKVTAKSRQS